MSNLTDLTRTLNLVCNKYRQDPRLPDFFLMSDDERLPDSTQTIINMPPGSAIVLRHRDPAIRQKLAFSLSPLCKNRRVALLIAGDIALARNCRADGVHFSQNSIARKDHKTQSAIHQNWIVTAAAHCRKSALQAHEAGIDAIFLSPVFATKSHPGVKSLGPLGFQAISQVVPTPIYGLGGMNRANIHRLKDCRLAGIAGIGYIADTVNRNQGVCLA
ncbi:MAG: hypothetical protein HON65_06685 [Rhodospirillales bacterium]|nr:hypothetical protein [Rhodospirillales bacterium]